MYRFCWYRDGDVMDLALEQKRMLERLTTKEAKDIRLEDLDRLWPGINYDFYKQAAEFVRDFRRS